MLDVDFITPAEPVTSDDIAKWIACVEQLAEVKEIENVMRKRIFKDFFPMAKEGTNKLSYDAAKNYNITSDFIVKGNMPILREIDETVLQYLSAKFDALGIDRSKVIKWKPYLVYSEYKKLPEKTRKFFDQCLKIKPGSLSLDISKREPKE